MLQFLGVLQEVQPAGIPTFQIAAKRQIVQNNDVLQPLVNTREMVEILDLFRGKTSLEAVASTTSTTVAPVNGWRAPTTEQGAADPAATAATDAPAQEAKGIVPPADVTC